MHRTTARQDVLRLMRQNEWLGMTWLFRQDIFLFFPHGSAGGARLALRHLHQPDLDTYLTQTHTGQHAYPNRYTSAHGHCNNSRSNPNSLRKTCSSKQMHIHVVTANALPHMGAAMTEHPDNIPLTFSHETNCARSPWVCLPLEGLGKQIRGPLVSLGRPPAQT